MRMSSARPILFAPWLCILAACAPEDGGFQPTSTTAPSTVGDETSDGSTSSPSPTTDPDPTLPPSTSTTEPDPSTTQADGSSGASAESSSSSSGGGDTSPRVHVFTLDEDTSTFGYSITHMLSEGPEDIDWSRWAVLHDGSEHRLYFLPEGRADEVYQFAYNVNTAQFEYGFKSLESIAIMDTPVAASTNGFGMAYVSGAYHLYFASTDNSTLYEYGYDAGSVAYVYGHNSTAINTVSGSPASTDWGGWGTAGEGSVVTLYAFASGAHDSIVRFGRPGASSDFAAVPGQLQIDYDGASIDASIDDFAIVDDGGTIALYIVEAG